MKYMLIISLSLFGCNESFEKPVYPDIILSVDEQTVVDQMPLDQRVYFKRCLITDKYYRDDTFTHCQKNLIQTFNPPSTVSSGSGAGHVLMGAAIGYGAARLLHGKKR